MGTTGQPAATSETSVGGTYSLVAGFWHTLAVPFTDSVLVPGVSMIRLIHVIELRQRIDSLRARFGVASYAWTDSVLVAGTTMARAVHVTDLRQALSQAYVAAGLMPPAYTAGVGVGLPITAAGIAELPAAVIALE